MNILAPGLTSTNSIQLTPVANSELLELATGQVIKAIVQRTANSQVWLDVGGHTLVARSEALLQAQQRVLLEVSQANPTQITLRVLSQTTPSPEAGATSPPPLPSTLDRLLTSWNLEPDDINQAIARALLTHSHTVNPDDIDTVRTLWRALPSASVPYLQGVGQEALLEPIVYLYSNQLPVGKESLALAYHWLNNSVQITQQLAELQQVLNEAQPQLQLAAGKNPALSQLAALVELAITQVSGWSISADMPPKEIMARMADFLIHLGTPPESQLADLVSTNFDLQKSAQKRGDEAGLASSGLDGLDDALATAEPKQVSGRIWTRPAQPLPEAVTRRTNSLYRLAAAITEGQATADLTEDLTQALQRVADRLDRVSNELGGLHLANLSARIHPSAESYYLFPIPLMTPEGPRTAQLKLYRQPGSATAKLDPENLRLALLLDLPGLGDMVINLTVHGPGKRLGGQILSSRDRTNRLVAAGMAEFRSNLAGLGYTVDSLTNGRLPPPPDVRGASTRTGPSGGVWPQVNVTA